MDFYRALFDHLLKSKQPLLRLLLFIHRPHLTYGDSNASGEDREEQGDQRGAGVTEGGRDGHARGKYIVVAAHGGVGVVLCGGDSSHWFTRLGPV